MSSVAQYQHVLPLFIRAQTVSSSITHEGGFVYKVQTINGSKQKRKKKTSVVFHTVHLLGALNSHTSVIVMLDQNLIYFGSRMQKRPKQHHPLINFNSNVCSTNTDFGKHLLYIQCHILQIDKHVLVTNH